MVRAEQGVRQGEDGYQKDRDKQEEHLGAVVMEEDLKGVRSV